MSIESLPDHSNEPRELDVLANAYRECFAEHLYLRERTGERSWMQLDKATRDAFRE